MIRSSPRESVPGHLTRRPFRCQNSPDVCKMYTGLALRIFFIFASLLREEGGGVQRGGGISLKSEEKFQGEKGGGEEG